ncbi:related to AFG1 - ATPase family gene [Pseudozyma flocculosa]|uniref:Related to AFG1 - ATPase family protein n=1 Tax=Pseudozyma flocculosa TaxID=84751 RepID=A0A5C3ETF9_9BASI|nr:related to AFG1 - ATPase family gene [Pseudozyma flocculosa]
MPLPHPRKSLPRRSTTLVPSPHRPLSTSSRSRSAATSTAKAPRDDPTTRYQALVDSGVLRDDAHQRSIVEVLQGLHDELRTYKQGPVPDPDEAIKPKSRGLLSWLPFVGGSGHGSGDDHHPIAVPEGVPKGLYLYGDVGTGKSMLMDLFYDTLPPNVTGKRRIHFHQFMIEAHKRAHYYKSKTHRPSGIVMMMSNPTALPSSSKASSSSSSSSAAPAGEESDAIEAVAREMSRHYSVLCFDEFQVTDIADAMILRGLLERIAAYGTVCVMTSNRHPDDLYKNGIQRSSFLPAIELLKRQYRVTDLNSGTDYRKQPRALSKVYFSPLDVANRREFDKIFDALTSDPDDPVQASRPLTIWGRTLKVPLSTSKVARFTFDELCGTPKSAADYIELCSRFNTVFVDAVPRMGLHQRDLARRFITFIDAAYESKTKLLASSEVPILQIFSGDKGQDKPTADQMRALMDDLGLTMDDLGGSPIFTGDEELFAFARVISRLTEMGTKQYAESSRPAYE